MRRLAICTMLTVLCVPVGCSSKTAPDMQGTSGMRAESALAPALAADEELAPQHNTESYDHFTDNPFILVARQPLSTFSIDVDTASYANVRRLLSEGQLPPKGAVRLEEMINYFHYAYAPPTDNRPFAVHLDVTECPWEASHRLVRIGLKGREIPLDERPPANLVFLIDVSGSMADPQKLPLVKRAMQLLVEQMTASDRIALAVYASASGLVLPSTPGDQKQLILEALDSLESGGSTNGGEGIRLAYRIAEEQKIPGGINRVLLCTDGDFNVGVTNQSDLVELIEHEAQRGVSLSVLGFGSGNYNDSTMEKLADKGDGNYAYIDTLQEARKVLVEQMSGTLLTIAKDVKLQVDFNGARVQAYRLLGYEDRMLAAEDFRDDMKDAGELGAGHTVTALYEIVPPGVEVPVGKVEPSKYQAGNVGSGEEKVLAADSKELLTVRLRYKLPDATESAEMRVPLADVALPLAEAPSDLRFAAAVAAFGMLLRDSPYQGHASYELAANLAQQNVGDDPQGYRHELVALIRKAQALGQP